MLQGINAVRFLPGEKDHSTSKKWQRSQRDEIEKENNDQRLFVLGRIEHLPSASLSVWFRFGALFRIPTTPSYGEANCIHHQ